MKIRPTQSVVLHCQVMSKARRGKCNRFLFIAFKNESDEYKKFKNNQERDWKLKRVENE